MASSSSSSSRRRPGALGERLGTPLHISAPRYLSLPARSSSSSAPVDESDINEVLARAKACRRAHRADREAEAWFCAGILHDNAGQHAKAEGCYDKFLRLVKELDNASLFALGYNAVGVARQLRGDFAGAIVSHRTHLDEFADTPGKFIAHTNLGLACSELGDDEKASYHLHHALRWAVLEESDMAQCLAIGNLGRVSRARGDADTALACVERFRELCHELNDRQSADDAALVLGDIAAAKGDYKVANEYFEGAYDTAFRKGDFNARNLIKAKIMLGVVRVEEQAAAAAAGWSPGWGEHGHDASSEEDDEDEDGAKKVET